MQWFTFQLCDPPDETDPARPRPRNLHQAPGGGEGEERQLRPRGLSTRFLLVFEELFSFRMWFLLCDGAKARFSWTLNSFFTFSFEQISALDREIIEVDPDTKDMLKMLVSSNSFPEVLVWNLETINLVSYKCISTIGVATPKQNKAFVVAVCAHHLVLQRFFFNHQKKPLCERWELQTTQELKLYPSSV